MNDPAISPQARSSPGQAVSTRPGRTAQVSSHLSHTGVSSQSSQKTVCSSLRRLPLLGVLASRRLRKIAAVVLSLIVAACVNANEQPLPDEGPVALGAKLYQDNCASCHRADLSGDPNWRVPNEDGSYRPPPHDANGHTWHHSDRVLMEYIRFGGRLPQSRMPAFGDKLSDEEIESILAFFKYRWGPDERSYQEEMTQRDEASP